MELVQVTRSAETMAMTLVQVIHSVETMTMTLPLAKVILSVVMMTHSVKRSGARPTERKFAD